MEFFVGKYPEILNKMDMDKLNEQFLEYQTLHEEDIPESVKAQYGFNPLRNSKINIS